MSLIVQKFGGSSVRDYAHLLRMARIVKSRVDEGDDVVVVLSAQGDTTDGLLQKAKEISERPSPRELDMLLSAGEQMSAAPAKSASDRSRKRFSRSSFKFCKPPIEKSVAICVKIC